MDVDGVPNTMAFADHRHVPGLNRVADYGGELDGETVEAARAEAVDGGGHYEVGFYVLVDAGVDDDEVGGALEVGLFLFAGFEIGVEVVLEVGEDAGFVVEFGDGAVGDVGGAGCLGVGLG